MDPRARGGPSGDRRLALGRLTALRALTVNAGSTSVKVVLVEGERALARHDSLDEALRRTTAAVDAVIHRVVHGGGRTSAVVVDDDVLGELRALTPLAPLHQPAALDAIERCRRAWPETVQVACFDTMFHTTIPAGARTYALPARLRSMVRVYGFHGLSHAWATHRVGELAPGLRRLVVAHLGGGQSLCGVLDGASLTTTMGFTPLDGLVMATRSGSLDPGAVLWLGEHTDEDLATVLERESGLLGLCGSSDMREVLDRREAGDDAARLAVDVYLHRFVHELGGCVAALGGLDALAFTGGVGEHSPRLRGLVAERVGWLGVGIDEHAEGEEVTAADAAVRVFVIESREDLQMAREAAAALAARP